jgi:hypothetical protein
MTTLYSMQRSGNCYKVRLALAQLNIPYRLVEIDSLKGDSSRDAWWENGWRRVMVKDAAKTAAEGGVVKFDIPHRVRAVY